MSKQDHGKHLPEDLRLRAEAKNRQQPAPEPKPELDLPTQSPDELHRILHELRVHQIELEMQNDELLRTQDDLALERARYFDLYDLAPVGYCSLSPAGLILEANLKADAMLGTDRSALIGKPFTQFILKEDQDAYYLLGQPPFDPGHPHGCDLRLVKKDGTLRWAHLTATVAQDASRNPSEPLLEDPGIRLVVTDISDRKQAEVETTKLEEQLNQAKKLETLGVLAGGIAHDFNNLLTTIIGNTNLASMVVDPKAEMVPFLVAIENAAMRAADLTRQLLAYAGKGKNVVSAVDLGLIAQEVTQLLSSSIPWNVTVRCDLAERLPFVTADATQMFQILLNLLTNATEAFPQGQKGLITVRARKEGVSESDLACGCWPLPVPPGDYVSLEVTDTGTGMTSETKARAFDPFYTTKFTGRGLGLAAVIGILSTHDAGLCVSSEPGRGSSFKVFLPPMARTEVSAPREVLTSWQGEGLILVVDDEHEVRLMVRRMAERLGFTVTEAEDGVQGLESFRANHKKLALVLLDFIMPGLNGQEALREMQKIDDSVPVILSSGFDTENLNPPMQGLAGILKKPYRVVEFQRGLERALSRSLLKPR